MKFPPDGHPYFPPPYEEQNNWPWNKDGFLVFASLVVGLLALGCVVKLADPQWGSFWSGQ